MLNFVRARDVDYVPTKLEDAAIYETLPQGSWLLPSGFSNGEVIYNVPASIDPVADANAIRNARISFSEMKAMDVKIAGEVTSLRGVLNLVTDQFIAADAASMEIGTELTLKLDSDGFVKLGVVSAATDVVKGVVEVSPGAHPEGHLVFHATLY